MTQSQEILEFPSLNSLLAWAHVQDYQSQRLRRAVLITVEKEGTFYYFKTSKTDDKFVLIATSSKDVFAEQEEKE